MAWSVCVFPSSLTRGVLNAILSSAALVYFGIMLYIVLGVLNEVRPAWYYVISAILFILSQLDYFLLSKVICRVRHRYLFHEAVLHTVTVIRAHQ